MSRPYPLAHPGDRYRQPDVRRVFAITLGVIGVIGTVWQHWAFGSDTGEFTVTGPPTSTVVIQSASFLLSAMLPAGVLLAASAFLRLQAVKFDTELTALSDEDEVAPAV